MKFATTFLKLSLCALVSFGTLFQAQPLQAQPLQAQPLQAQPLQAQNFTPTQSVTPSATPQATPKPNSTPKPTVTPTPTATPQITIVPVVPQNTANVNAKANAPKFSDARDERSEDRVLDVAPRDIGEEWLRFDTSLKSTVSRMGLKLPLPQSR